eukprot:TRINITY_DN179_c0_g1_i1.p1 TRINITY_DN179_c0_g1~~TRINITY_DN179_c0_g1_i1.p1  ORF type:complete len:428 (-),score=85.93 TRINITY_DN179_c0_g1_i1:211-1494(-)
MELLEKDQFMQEVRDKATRFYAEKNYDKAIELYSKGIELEPNNATLYCNRAAAFCWLKRFEEALQDAERTIQLKPDWPKAYVRKATALISLRRFAEARECYLQLQGTDPTSLETKRGLTELESILRLEESKVKAPSLLEDFECPLCLKLYFEPVTTPCGHSFCRSCLLRALDHGAGCPICRNVMHISANHPITITLQKMVQTIFPKEYEARKQEKENELVQNETCLPLFLLNAVTFPKLKFPMHIFEPRYRLMLRRCLEGDRLFGLVNCKKEGNHWVPHGIGTTLRILDVKPLPDGRSHICTVAERRFKILEKWDQDGYMCGKVEWYDEDEVKPEEREEFDALCSSIKSLVANLLPKASTCSGVAELLERAGDMPSDGLDLSFWLAGLLPLSSKVKQDLLEMKSTMLRLKILEKVLNCSENEACYVQ